MFQMTEPSEWGETSGDATDKIYASARLLLSVATQPPYTYHNVKMVSESRDILILPMFHYWRHCEAFPRNCGLVRESL